LFGIATITTIIFIATAIAVVITTQLLPPLLQLVLQLVMVFDDGEGKGA
jgi:hypothetical protein